MNKLALVEDQSKWVKGKNQPFEGGFQKYENIPKGERSNCIRSILKQQQLNIPQPFTYQRSFPAQSKFKYKQYYLHYYSIEQSPLPKAILIIMHGANSNGSIYGYLSSKIAEKNAELNIYAFDQMNFGKSQGNVRGLIVSLEHSVDQAEKFIQTILQKFKKKPKVFLCGHSFGGTMAFKMTLLRSKQYSGILFLAPGLKNITQGHYYSKKLMVFLGWLMPSLRVSIPAPSGMGTKYNVKKKWENDPLIFTDGMMPGTIRSVVNGVEQISKLFNKFQAPFLCIAPGVQKFVDPFGPLDLYEECSAQDKQIIYVEDMWHVVAEEEEIVGVSWHCAEWLKDRI